MVAIIGAGISGLSLAYFLEKKGINYELFEASSRVGGLISSTKVDNYLLETGPNSILCDDFILDFLKELGLEQDFIYPTSDSHNRYIYKNGRYQKLPDNPISLVLSSFFSWKTKLAVFREMNKKAVQKKDETLAQFFERRFSKEIVDYALNPFVSGIYAGDPEQLLLNKTFPSLIEYEQNYGSVLKGLIKNKTGKRKQSLNFTKGMELLPKAIASKLSHIKLNTSVISLSKNNDKTFELQTNEGVKTANKIVFACSTKATSKILLSFKPELSSIINSIDYPPMTAVYSAFKKADVGFKLAGFGGLNPKIENQFSAGSIWTSSILPDRCPNDEVLFTSFVGGVQYKEHTNFSDDEIKQRVGHELMQQYNIKTKPVFQHITKWPLALPQYTVALNNVYDQIAHQEQEGIFFSSNWNEGISLGDCIKKGEKFSRKFE
jgi:oxygen-dependent protoporphyrinogen oxidase